MLPVILIDSTWIQTGIENYDVGSQPIVSIQGLSRANESEIFKSRQGRVFILGL